MAALLLASVTLAGGACVEVRNLLADRDLVCQDTPDDVCIRVAEAGLGRLDVASVEREVGPIPQILVIGMPCRQAELGVDPGIATRCWEVQATNDRGGQGVLIVERPDGSLAYP